MGPLKSAHVQTHHKNKDSSRWTALPVQGEWLPVQCRRQFWRGDDVVFLVRHPPGTHKHDHAQVHREIAGGLRTLVPGRQRARRYRCDRSQRLSLLRLVPANRAACSSTC